VPPWAATLAVLLQDASPEAVLIVLEGNRVSPGSEPFAFRQTQTPPNANAVAGNGAAGADLYHPGRVTSPT
jgi:hypothetical protein